MSLRLRRRSAALISPLLALAVSACSGPSTVADPDPVDPVPVENAEPAPAGVVDGIAPRAGVLHGETEDLDGLWLSFEAARLVPIDGPVDARAGCIDAVDGMIVVHAPAAEGRPEAALALDEVALPAIYTRSEAGCREQRVTFVDATPGGAVHTIEVDDATPLAIEAIDVFPDHAGPEVVSLGRNGVRIDTTDGPHAIRLGDGGIPLDANDAATLAVQPTPPWLDLVPPALPVEHLAPRDPMTALEPGETVFAAWWTEPVFALGLEEVGELDDARHWLGLPVETDTPEPGPDDEDLDDDYGDYSEEALFEAAVSIEAIPGGTLIAWRPREQILISDYGSSTTDLSSEERYLRLADGRSILVTAVERTGESSEGEHGAGGYDEAHAVDYAWLADSLPADAAQPDAYPSGAWVATHRSTATGSGSSWHFMDFEDVLVNGVRCPWAQGDIEGETWSEDNALHWQVSGPDGDVDLPPGHDYLMATVEDALDETEIDASNRSALLHSSSHTLEGVGLVRFDFSADAVAVVLPETGDTLELPLACDALEDDAPFLLSANLGVDRLADGLLFVEASARSTSKLGGCHFDREVWWRPGVGIVAEPRAEEGVERGQVDNCADEY